MRIFLTLVFPLLLLLPAPASAKKLKPIDEVLLELGRDDENTLRAQVWDGSSGPRVFFEPFTCACQPGDPLVVMLKNSKGLFGMGTQPDLGTLFRDALRVEAATLGLRTARAREDADWVVTGHIERIEMAMKAVPFGPLLFYSHARVTLKIAGEGQGGAGHPLQLHNLQWRFNGGFGIKDEAAEALAHLVVESSQEILGYLASVAEFPATAAVDTALDAVRAYGVSDREVEVRMVGLSGDWELASELLALLPRQDQEDERIEIYDALANLREPSVVSELTRWYDKEDEDARYFILKALAYIGSEDALAFLQERSLRDPDRGCRKLGERALAGR
jgi:hypothetical protein